VAGYVVRDPARTPSNWRRTAPSSDRLRDRGVVGDRRRRHPALTRHLRERGAMRSGSSTIVDRDRAAARPGSRVRRDGRADLVRRGDDRTPYTCRADGEHRSRGGARPRHQAQHPATLAARGVRTHVLPASSPTRSLGTGADAVFYSNGPGDPAPPTRVAVPPSLLRSGVPSSASASATSCLGRALGSAPTSCGTATAASTSRCWTARPARSRSPRTTTGSPSDAPGRVATDRVRRVEVSHVCLNDERGGGLR
jgi:carbamoyl-phosphate synthase small subunit